MKHHFKAIKVKILSSFLFLQIRKFIFGFIAKRIEALVWIEQQTCRCFHIGVALVTSPFFIHVDTFSLSFLLNANANPLNVVPKSVAATAMNVTGEERKSSPPS